MTDEEPFAVPPPSDPADLVRIPDSAGCLRIADLDPNAPASFQFNGPGNGEWMRLTVDGFVEFPGGHRIPSKAFIAALRGFAAGLESILPKNPEPTAP